MTQETFASLYPEAFYLDYQLTPSLVTYLRQQGWISKNESVLSLDKPGEGNMNFVMRVRTDQQTFIVKQARPWVQKYPQVPAPIERIGVEAAFYEGISTDATLRLFVPKLKGYDPLNFTLALEDVGSGGDFTYIYKKGQQLTFDELTALVDFISKLHLHTAVNFPTNANMKALNHEHIFRFPFDASTGFNLDSVQAGLAKLGLFYQQHIKLKAAVSELGNLYLETSKTLIHGDYYPGSWLKVPAGVKVIDPEFSFMGRAEFDLGVLMAHLKMSQNETLINEALSYYHRPNGFDESMMWGFAGTEILRRLLGLAQLPLSMSLTEKEELMHIASAYII